MIRMRPQNWSNLSPNHSSLSPKRLNLFLHSFYRLPAVILSRHFSLPMVTWFYFLEANNSFAVDLLKFGKQSTVMLLKVHYGRNRSLCSNITVTGHEKIRLKYLRTFPVFGAHRIFSTLPKASLFFWHGRFLQIFADLTHLNLR